MKLWEECVCACACAWMSNSLVKMLWMRNLMRMRAYRLLYNKKVCMEKGRNSLQVSQWKCLLYITPTHAHKSKTLQVILTFKNTINKLVFFEEWEKQRWNCKLHPFSQIQEKKCNQFIIFIWSDSIYKI